MIIQHNMPAANTNRQLGITNGNLQKSTEKLSSGYRINRAGDDAAGLSISEKMRGQIRGLNQASTNAQDGISMIQTAEGAMNELHSVVQRMRELTVQAANDTNVAEDRMAIQSEIKQLSEEIDRIAQSTEFNTMKLLNGDYSEDGERGKLTLQVGANNSSTDVLDDGDQVIKFSLNAMTTDVIGGETGTVSALFMLTIDDATGFEDADIAASIAADLDILDEALKYVSDERSKLGAIQNRLEHTIANTDNTAENLQAAESRIRDVDMAEQMVDYSKDTILQQAAQSMLAQANQQTQGVLALLQ
ncbi:MAG: flagellin [Lachnospiraceae bacterium]|jgi:flagellin|nr:flagellin [Lachnospiraceae bacterium]